MRRTSVIHCAIAFAASACQVNQQPAASEATQGSETTVEVVEQPAAAPAQPAPQPAPVALTQEQLVAHYDACNQQWLDGKWDDMKAQCLASDITAEMPGSGQPATKGADAIVTDGKTWHAALSEIQMTPIVLLVSGGTFLNVGAYTGKQTGELMGVPASGKPVGMYGAEIMEFTSDGRAHAQRTYFDLPTLMGQIGASKGPHRKAITPAGTPRVLAVASGSEQEKANLELVRGLIKAWNEGDWKTLRAGFGKSWLHRDVAMPQDQTGGKAFQTLRGYKRAFPDAKLTETRAIAAGDYVALEQRFTGTNTGRNPAMGLKKPTGKAIDTGHLQLFKVQDGKVVEGWELGNTTMMAAQLGLIAAPGQPAAGGAGAAPSEKPGAKPAKPAVAAKPAKPAAKAKPAVPTQPAAKAQPATPATPAQPAKGKGAATAAQPAQPATPVQPANK